MTKKHIEDKKDAFQQTGTIYRLEKSNATSTLMKWCPTMDLLAVCTDSYQLCVSRHTGGQRVFKHCLNDTNSHILLLSWSPDGRKIAISSNHALLSFIDVESQKLEAKLVLEDDIVHIEWAESCFLYKTNALRRHCEWMEPRFWVSKMPRLAPVFGKSPIEKLDNEDIAQESSEFKLEIMAAVSKTSKILFLASQVFQLYSADLFEVLSSDIFGYNSLITSVQLQKDLNYLLLCLNGSSHPHETIACWINVSWLSKNAEIIHKISQICVQLDNYSNHLKEVISQMVSEYDNVSKSLKSKMKSLEKLLDLNDQGQTRTSVSEFTQLFARGVASSEMIEFLRGTGFKGWKKWINTIESGYLSLKKLGNSHLSPICERILLNLSELMGCTKWNAILENLTFDELSLQDSINCVVSLSARYEEMLKTISHDETAFKSFSRWLVQALYLYVGELPEDFSMPNMDTEIDDSKVGTFLKDAIFRDKLHQFFVANEVNAELRRASSSYIETIPIFGRSNQFMKTDYSKHGMSGDGDAEGKEVLMRQELPYFLVPPSLSSSCLVLDHEKSSLMQLRSELSENLAKILKNGIKFSDCGLDVQQVIRFGARAAGNYGSSKIASFQTDNEWLLADFDHSGSVFNIVKCEKNSLNFDTSIASIAMDEIMSLNCQQGVIEFKFLSSDDLLVLVKDTDDEDSSGCLLGVPLENLEFTRIAHSKDIDITKFDVNHTLLSEIHGIRYRNVKVLPATTHSKALERLDVSVTRKLASVLGPNSIQIFDVDRAVDEDEE